MTSRALIITTIILGLVFKINAQKVKEPKPYTTDWAKPYQPFCIAGNLYYVGTYDLACYLITTPQGHILINTGLKSSAQQIKNNIATLGFKFKDIKILLTTQAHYDHLGAMAMIKKQTGAMFMVNKPDAEGVQTGGNSDYALGGEGSTFKPIAIDKYLNDGDTITLGNMQLKMLSHPGHTKGSCSYLFTVTDKLRSYKVLIANMPTIVTEKPFKELSTYTAASTDYAYTLQSLKKLQFDIWVASHAGQFNLHDKHKPDDAYNPMAFADKAGFDKSLAELQQDYDDKIKKETANK
jgi:metallo-beta-lactamase class B